MNNVCRVCGCGDLVVGRWEHVGGPRVGRLTFCVWCRPVSAPIVCWGGKRMLGLVSGRFARLGRGAVLEGVSGRSEVGSEDYVSE